MKKKSYLIKYSTSVICDGFVIGNPITNKLIKTKDITKEWGLIKEKSSYPVDLIDVVKL